MAGEKQVIDVPLANGLNTKADPRSMQAPGLAVCEDVQFEEIGGMQTRPQYQPITDSASNTIADIRKIVEYGDELVAFSKDKLWSYASNDGLWTERAEYLAVKVDEQARFVSTGEQYDGDRAELGGVTMYAWTEDTPSGTVSYVAAVDTATGSVKLSPVAIKSGSTRPSLLVSTNKIFLVFVVAATPAIWVRAYDPSDLTSAETTESFSALVSFDAVVNATTPTEIIVAMSRGANTTLVRYSETPAKLSEATNARVADGAISIAFDAADGDRLCVTRSDGTAIESDIHDAALADVSVGVSTGTSSSATVNSITSAYNGSSVCQLFWTADRGAGSVSTFVLETNTITNAGSAGTEASVVFRCSLASKAFEREGSVFVWAVFDEVSQGDLTAQLQNSYFLYRSDGFLSAKAVAVQAAGIPASEGYLPNVQDLGADSFAWLGGLRRIIPLGQQQQGYAAKSLQEVSFSFDSNEARRTAKLGETLYIAGANVSQYDGRTVAEVGFHTFPWFIAVSRNVGTNLEGTYNWKQSFSWYNAKGEFERSSTATIKSAVMIASSEAAITANNTYVTAKTGINKIAVEYWRQIDAAPVGAPFFLVTSKDPASTGDNKYIENNIATQSADAFTDDLLDSDLISRETFPENGGLSLASLAPPPASIVIATQDRLILAGIPGNPNRIVYSRLRGLGEVASFNDFLTVDLPPDGGAITALAFMNETLVAFKATATYMLPGDGYDNNGGGSNYGPARVIDNDVGAISMETVTLTPKGLIFKSSKGWYLVQQSWTTRYIGAGVEQFDTDTIVACHSMDSQHQVRCVSATRTLVWDHLINEWFVWTLSSVSATMFGNVHHLVNSAADGALAQAATYSGSGDLPGLDVESAWIKVEGLQGFKLVRRIIILGEYLGAHDLRVRVAYNYKETALGPTWVDDKTWTVSPTVVKGPLQVQHGPSRPKCESIKVRITAQAIGVTTHPITQALNLTALSLEIALRKGVFAGLPAAQKQ